MVNAPVMGLITSRPPAALRAKVLTAVMTASGIGSPIGRILVGPVYRAWGNGGVWVLIAGGLSLGSVAFIGAVTRALRRGAPNVVAVPTVTDG
jgi:hypothetical protein